MKKPIILLIVLVLLVASFSTVLAAPWKNPNGYWIWDVDCGAGTFDVFVANSNTEASFDQEGGVGVMKALYIDFGNGYELVWRIAGKGVFKHTTYCEWTMELDGQMMNMAGDVLIP